MEAKSLAAKRPPEIVREAPDLLDGCQVGGDAGGGSPWAGNADVGGQAPDDVEDQPRRPVDGERHQVEAPPKQAGEGSPLSTGSGGWVDCCPPRVKGGRRRVPQRVDARSLAAKEHVPDFRRLVVGSLEKALFFDT